MKPNINKTNRRVKKSARRAALSRKNSRTREVALSFSKRRGEEIIIGDTKYYGRNPVYQFTKVGNRVVVQKIALGVPFVKIEK